MVRPILHAMLWLAATSAAVVADAHGLARGTDTLAVVCEAGATPRIREEVYQVVVGPATAFNRQVYTASESQRIREHADALRRFFTPPPSLGDVPLLGESWISAWGGSPIMHSAVSGRLVLVMRPTGVMRSWFWQVPPLAKVFEQAVANAVTAAAAANAFRAIPRVDPELRDDTLVIQFRTAVGRTAGDEFPLMRALLRRYDLDSPVRLVIRGRIVHPPNVLYTPGQNFGEILALIGSDGVAVAGAARVTRIERPGFVRTMNRFVDESRYAPARSGGCAVPSLMLHSFDFSSGR